MDGYRWYVQVRITPPNGAAETIDLMTDLTRVPGLGPAQVELEYTVQRKDRQDINRRLRSRIDGVRPTVTLTIEAGGDMADSAIVARILNALLDREKAVELTLDGGTAWREVELSKFKGPTPNRGKTFAGCRWEITLLGVDLLTEIPDLMQGNW